MRKWFLLVLFMGIVAWGCSEGRRKRASVAPSSGPAAPGGGGSPLASGWVQTIDPSPFGDTPRGIALDGSGLYAVGLVGVTDLLLGDSQWRMEKRNPADGALVWTKESNPSAGHDGATDVAADPTGIYVAGWHFLSHVVGSGTWNGQWRIEKRSLTDGALLWSQTSDPTAGDDRPWGVAVDETGVYLAGIQSTFAWRVEKRDRDTGLLLWSQVYSAAQWASAFDVAVDGTGLYVVGFEEPFGVVPFGSGGRARIEKRSLASGALLWAHTDDPASGIVVASAVGVDATGLYVVGRNDAPGTAGQWRIEKRTLATGALLWSQEINPSGSFDTPTDVAVGPAGLYVAGVDSSTVSGDWQWRIEKLDLATGTPLRTELINPSSANEICWAVAVDSTGVYAVGADATPGAGVPAWRIVKMVPP